MDIVWIEILQKISKYHFFLSGTAYGFIGRFRTDEVLMESWPLSIGARGPMHSGRGASFPFLPMHFMPPPKSLCQIARRTRVLVWPLTKCTYMRPTEEWYASFYGTVEGADMPSSLHELKKVDWMRKKWCWRCHIALVVCVSLNPDSDGLEAASARSFHSRCRFGGPSPMLVPYAVWYAGPPVF